VIWAGFGPIGNTEKKVWADYEQLLRAEKLHNINLRFFLIFFFAHQNMKKPPSNRAKFTINCVLLYWRYLPVRRDFYIMTLDAVLCSEKQVKNK
jgi:hypothetical protein